MKVPRIWRTYAPLGLALATTSVSFDNARLPRSARGVPWASRPQLWPEAGAGSRWVGALGRREPRPQMQWRGARQGTPDPGTPRAARVWGARARARAVGDRAAAPTAPPGRGQRRPDTRVLGSLRTCPPARPAPGHALSQSQAPGGKRHGHLWRLLSRRNATSKGFSYPTLEDTSAFPSHLCGGRQARPRNCPKGD